MLLRTSDISFMITIIGIVNGLALLSTVAGEERQKKYLHLFLAITKTTNVLLIPTALSVTFSCTQVKLTMVNKMVVTNQANRFSCIFLSPIFPPRPCVSSAAMGPLLEQPVQSYCGIIMYSDASCIKPQNIPLLSSVTLYHQVNKGHCYSASEVKWV